MKVRYFGFALAAALLLSVSASAGRATSLAFDKPGWTLIFNDEFVGTTLNTALWDTCYPWIDHNNCNLADSNELQLYLPDKAFVDGSGQLVMRAEKKTVNGFDYTSGMVSSEPGFNFKYGYVEARVKLPAGKGLWPAFWMLPVNDGPWPQEEIDIMENLGQDPSTAYFTYHWVCNGSQTCQDQHAYMGANFSAGWHTFAVDWGPGTIIWYVDDVERARYTRASNITGKPMFVILNLAVGGDWPGSPDASTPFPSDYQVDYVRVWQKTYRIFLPHVKK